MLRITVHDKPRAVTFQLEGIVTEPWLAELERCWGRTLADQRTPTLHIDLTDVTSIDVAGQACLAALHRQGAKFIAADCLTKAAVDEITQTRLLDWRHSNGKGERRPKRNRGAT